MNLDLIDKYNAEFMPLIEANKEIFDALEFTKIKTHNYFVQNDLTDVINTFKLKCLGSLLYYAIKCYEYIIQNNFEELYNYASADINSIDNMAIALAAVTTKQYEVLDILSGKNYDFYTQIFHDNDIIFLDESKIVFGHFHIKGVLLEYIINHADSKVIKRLVNNGLKYQRYLSIEKFINDSSMIEYLIDMNFFDGNIESFLNKYLNQNIKNINMNILIKILELGANINDVILKGNLCIDFMKESPMEKLDLLLNHGFTEIELLTYFACIKSQIELIEIILQRGYTLSDRCIDCLMDKLCKPFIELFIKYQIDLSKYQLNTSTEIEIQSKKLEELGLSSNVLSHMMLKNVLTKNNSKFTNASDLRRICAMAQNIYS
ncbi:ankyrin repeat protein [Megavirus baoshan]|uniref:Ankyrin repeat protein n=1 Tax=Megavirus baoshan TaxID=2496520 RepID=A0A3Q8U8H3_9VIRU|nr:ankyrin repeat protein [Megavirus baoshan]AZL89747.1 ankyrin repeat protein [Megavirus baoshan]